MIIDLVDDGVDYFWGKPRPPLRCGRMRRFIWDVTGCDLLRSHLVVTTPGVLMLVNEASAKTLPIFGEGCRESMRQRLVSDLLHTTDEVILRRHITRFGRMMLGTHRVFCG